VVVTVDAMQGKGGSGRREVTNIATMIRATTSAAGGLELLRLRVMNPALWIFASLRLHHCVLGTPSEAVDKYPFAERKNDCKPRVNKSVPAIPAKAIT